MSHSISKLSHLYQIEAGLLSSLIQNPRGMWPLIEEWNIAPHNFSNRINQEIFLHLASLRYDGRAPALRGPFKEALGKLATFTPTASNGRYYLEQFVNESQTR